MEHKVKLNFIQISERLINKYEDNQKKNFFFRVVLNFLSLY